MRLLGFFWVRCWGFVSNEFILCLGYYPITVDWDYRLRGLERSLKHHHANKNLVILPQQIRVLSQNLRTILQSCRQVKMVEICFRKASVLLETVGLNLLITYKLVVLSGLFLNQLLDKFNYPVDKTVDCSVWLLCLPLVENLLFKLNWFMSL